MLTWKPIQIYGSHKQLFNLFWLKCVNKMHPKGARKTRKAIAITLMAMEMSTRQISVVLYIDVEQFLILFWHTSVKAYVGFLISRALIIQWRNYILQNQITSPTASKPM